MFVDILVRMNYKKGYTYEFLNSAAGSVTSSPQPLCRRQTSSQTNCVSLPKAAVERTEGCQSWPGSSSSGSQIF